MLVNKHFIGLSGIRIRLYSQEFAGSVLTSSLSSPSTTSQNYSPSVFQLRLPETQRKTSRYPQRVRPVFKLEAILPDVTLNDLSLEKRQRLYEKSKRDGKPRPERFAVLLFRSLIPRDVYRNWAGMVNFEGSRGKNALPINLRKAIFETIEQTLQVQMTPCDCKMIKGRLNEFLRSIGRTSRRRKALNKP